MWDAREPTRRPIYTTRSSHGHIMLCFSPNDRFILTSAIDNEIVQHSTVTGMPVGRLDMQRTGLSENYTRAYYMNGGNCIVSGSSEEDLVRLHCAHTGVLLNRVQLYPGRAHHSLYVQSLRGDPFRDHNFSVLINYRDTASPLQIVKVDMLHSGSGEDIGHISSVLAYDDVVADMSALLEKTKLENVPQPPPVPPCVDAPTCDFSEEHAASFPPLATILLHSGERMHAHAAVLACRCGKLYDKVSHTLMMPSCVNKPTVEYILEYFYTGSVAILASVPIDLYMRLEFGIEGAFGGEIVRRMV